MKHFKVTAASIAAFVSIVYYMNVTVEPLKPDVDLLTARCRYDTRELCPHCFPRPIFWAYCTMFEYNIEYTDTHRLSRATFEEFEHHSIRHDIKLGDDPNIVINNLNRKRTIEKLRDKICAELGISKNCHMGNNTNFLEKLRKQVADDHRVKGATMCPSNDESAVERFVRKFKQPELLTLLLMASNSQSLMVLLGSEYKLPVPSFVSQEGFILVETIQGQILPTFSLYPIQMKLKIAHELINAFFKLHLGVDEFRFFLRSVNPFDIMVNVLPDETVQITFAALDNVVIFNDVNGTLRCDHYAPGCNYAYVWGSDVNLLQLCRVFVEDVFRERGKGFLRFLYQNDTVEEYEPIKQLLQRCLYCEHPNCENLYVLFTKIQKEINKLSDVLNKTNNQPEED